MESIKIKYCPAPYTKQWNEQTDVENQATYKYWAYTEKQQTTIQLCAQSVN